MDGTALNYTVVDKETGNSLGAPGSPINVFFLDGNATAGWDMQVKTWNERIDFAASLMAKFGSLLASVDPLALGQATYAMAMDTLSSSIPRLRGRCMARVEGGRNVNRVDLAKIAYNVCLDRCQGNIITSLFFTQNLNADEGQIVEARMEWMPIARPNSHTANVVPAALIDPTGYMSMRNDYTLQGVGFSYPNTGRKPNNPLPRGYGTRGDYVQQMAVQALSTPQNAPPAVPNVDTPAAAVTDLNVIQ